MPKIPSLTAKKLLQFFLRQKFVIDRQTGSHVILYRSNDKKRAVIPFHRKDIPKGTFVSILRESGYSAEDFLKLWK